MSHELDFRGEEAAMAFTGQKAWHRLGQELEEDAPIEVWLKAAHMDWEIMRAVAEYRAVNNVATDGVNDLMLSKIFPEKHVLYRSDDLSPLSVVSSSYKIVQPYEVLEFYKDLVGVAGMKLETAGVLFGGRRFWALANTGKFAELRGNDTVKGYLLLTTSCDGTLATTAQFTSVRVVCNNTLSIALSRGGSDRIKVPHNRVWNPNDVKVQLGLVDEGWENFKDQIFAMSERHMTRSEAAEFLVRLYGDVDILGEPANADNISEVIAQQSPVVADKCASVYDLFGGKGVGASMASANGTLWGLVNAVTETVDWHTGHRTVDAQVNNAWYGSGAALKTKAFNLGLELMAA